MLFVNVADGGATEATNIEFANADDEDDDNDDGGGIDEDADADADEDELLVDDDDSAFPSCFSLTARLVASTRLIYFSSLCAA